MHKCNVYEFSNIIICLASHRKKTWRQWNMFWILVTWQFHEIFRRLYNFQINWNKYIAEAYFCVEIRILLRKWFHSIAQLCRSAKFFGQNVWSTLGIQGGWRQNSNWKMAAIIHCTLLILYNQVREDYFDDIFEARRPITNIPSHHERIIRCLQLWSFVLFLTFLFFSNCDFKFDRCSG